MIGKFKVSAALLLCNLFLCSAQGNYRPTYNWPYLFEDFTPAVIHQTGGRKDIPTQVNITVDGGYLHHIGNGTILQTNVATAVSVDVGERKFLLVGGHAKEVMLQGRSGAVLKEYVYVPKSDGVDIGYGINSTTVAASNLDLTASVMLGINLIHAKVNEAAMEKEYSEAVNFEEKLYLYVKGQMIPASKKDVQEYAGKDKTSAFLKANKIKWSEIASLAKVLEFLENLE